MALQKKNVLHALQQGDEFQPCPGQIIVKYLKGVGNNLHEVETYDGSSFLVTMPKKFRNVVYLAKGNCIVIDPIEEGNKVKGEIVCILEPASVTRLIQGKIWPVVTSDVELSSSRDQISAFFLKVLDYLICRFFPKIISIICPRCFFHLSRIIKDAIITS